MFSKNPIMPEPSAEMRNAANSLGAIFNSFVEAGFTRAEALELLVIQMENARGNDI